MGVVCFHISIPKNNNKTSVEMLDYFFLSGLHQKDKALLEQIKKSIFLCASKKKN